jgi:CheY-like chemotaxis protein
MLIPVDPNAAPLKQEPTSLRSPSRYSGTVLLADDEHAVRKVAKQMLERLGFTVLTVRDGQAAIAAYREHLSSLSLVLMDLTMPRLDGREALSEMRSTDSRLPHVILMSGHSEQDAMERFSDVPAVSFLQKPFTPERLHEEIARAWQAPQPE